MYVCVLIVGQIVALTSTVRISSPFQPPSPPPLAVGTPLCGNRCTNRESKQLIKIYNLISHAHMLMYNTHTTRTHITHTRILVVTLLNIPSDVFIQTDQKKCKVEISN